MEQPLLIHIGFHKTGTTWLQRELFISSNHVFEPFSNKKIGQSNLAFKFIKGEDGNVLPPFDNNIECVQRELLKLLQLKRTIENKIFVMSSERLSGNPHSSAIDGKNIAHRLKYVFPNAKIFISIREQKSFLLSNYYQYLSRGGLNSLKRYLNLKYDYMEYKFSPNHIKYHLIIEEYQKLFGKENVLVLPYEMLKDTPQEYIQSIGNFVEKKITFDESRFEVRHNTKSNHFIMYHLRFLSYFLFSNSLNNYSRLHNRFSRFCALVIKKITGKIIPNTWNKKIQLKMKKEITTFSSNRYAVSNTVTSNLINTDLSNYGYDME